MKKILMLCLILFGFSAFAQQDYSTVMDLLLNNKREEARKLFNKQFGKTKDKSIDLLFLDAMIDEQNGRINYDATLLQKIEKLPNAVYYIDPFINDNFVMANVNDEKYDDLTFEKIDFLAQSEVFRNRDIVKYRKAVSENKRLRYEEGKKYIAQLHTISAWQFCGVFENLNSSGLDTEYEPETYAKNDKVFEANSNGQVGWYNPKIPEYDGYNFFSNESEYGRGIMYAQTFVDVPADKEYLLQFGTSSGIKVFVDDVEVASAYETGRTNINAFNYWLTLSKGTHRILLKVECSGNDYFSARLVNKDLSNPTELQFSSVYKDYAGGTTVAATETTLDYEKYFQDLVTKNPENVLYKLFLFKAYEANHKKELAHKAIEGLDTKYPKSSLIARYMIGYYSMDDNYDKIEELNKNIENNDEDYYYTVLLKMKDGNWLKEAQIKDLESYAEKSKKYISKTYSLLFQFMVASRQSNIDKMFELLDDLIAESHNKEGYILSKANLYNNLKDDKTTYIEILEGIVKEHEDFDAVGKLVEFYSDSNRKEDVKQIILSRLKVYPYFNSLRDAYIGMLINENQYKEALTYVDENLEFFPYSFENFEQKADIYRLMKDNKQAETYYLKALSHDSSNSSLRKKLYDLTNTPDEIEVVETKDVYDLIEKRRNTALKGDYGVSLLLDEYIVNVLPEGGRKSKVRFIYEVTAENGIENLKEYSLNTYGINLIKSEIVKKNGTLVPAEDSGSMLVFPNLEVGDVVYIEYDYYSNSYGRFYKDFTSGFTFNGSYPVVESTFSIIHDPSLDLKITSKNGNVKLTEKKLKKKVIKQWKQENTLSIPIYEKYAPEYSDLTKTISVGTIKSWSVIADWYADLVKKNIKYDRITQNAFKEIFPEGINGISENERAEKIYRYICDNITYSFLDFRQSGYVPQKPSKTLTTKLGDCKDLSTLFVTLAQEAGLQSNLVLVLTNDNGFKTLSLPSKDFNHCIVRVMIDGKETFLEMTDRYLPFKALPISLYHANALVINFDKAKNQEAQLINIPFDNAIVNKNVTKTIINVSEDKKEFTNNHVLYGSPKSYYNELFSNATTEDVRKKEFEEMYNSRLNKVVLMKDSKLLSTDKYSESVNFETGFTVNEKLQQLGSLKILSIPFIDQVYTKDIISKENRNYSISYITYENVKDYESEVVLNIPEGSKFIELPENKDLSYKGHHYELQYELAKPNQLVVKRKVTLDWNDIPSDDYADFKKYVEEVIAAEEQIVGYK
ncbi:hypothetical protein NHF50_12330 [Flavobacterium sp. NRK F10]|uniref:transglutaminase domain-containing protein n=1 Tax=Flavobacterium sp. NRK F10 TaxID=2954931 RepID=UPI0020919713|nr:transglutaminase domain-containing protein [Flavobacterium sp. NRK F10]MCO6175831.1 hypothetical protein [Flavobacterium sp. NRK F10]